MVLTNRSLSMPTSSGAHSGVIVISDTVWWCLVSMWLRGVAVRFAQSTGGNATLVLCGQRTIPSPRLSLICAHR